jgi:hypothetical protein
MVEPRAATNGSKPTASARTTSLRAQPDASARSETKRAPNPFPQSRNSFRPCVTKLGKGESFQNVKPFTETLRVTNPVRQSRASSREASLAWRRVTATARRGARRAQGQGARTGARAQGQAQGARTGARTGVLERKDRAQGRKDRRFGAQGQALLPRGSGARGARTGVFASRFGAGARTGAFAFENQ